MTRLPAEAYVQSEFFQREKRGLFAREWLLFCAAGQLAAAGDFINHTLGGWPVFAVRGSDGVARGFRNVCRHQNMPVLDKPSGQCAEIRCRFHGWTYDLGGTLIAAPPQYAPAEPLDHVRLEAIELAEQGALAFSRLTPGEAGPPPAVAPDTRAFAGAVTTDVDANWKALVEFLLPEHGRDFLWPNAFVGDGGDRRIIRQIVPRTFSRTRIIDLVFGADAAVTQTEQAAQADKKAAEALHARLAAGEAGPDTPDCARFRSRVEAACAAADAAAV